MCQSELPRTPVPFSGNSSLSPVEVNLSTVAYGTYIPLPGVWECAEQKADFVVQSPSLTYELGMFERFLSECASELPTVGNYISPSGRLEIVRPSATGDFWVRVPDDKEGYGPFETRSAAQDWATNNFSQFFGVAE
jgi:hypothetical protein